MALKIDPATVGSHLARLSWVAMRSFFGTLFVFMLAGVVLAGASYYFVRDSPALYCGLAVAVALAEAGAIGVLLGLKRAITMTLVHALGSLHLGSKIVRLIFDRMLSEGSVLAGGLERIPLAQAEQMLKETVVDVLGDDDRGGWLRRRIRGRLVRVVEKYTLSRVREQGATQGSVDLQRIRGDLENGVDAALVGKIGGGMRLWMRIALVALPVVVAAQTWVGIVLLNEE